MQRDNGRLKGEAVMIAPDFSQFVDRSEHTCGTEAEKLWDNSMIQTEDL